MSPRRPDSEAVAWHGQAIHEHNLTRPLARWLLMMRDRSDDDAPPISQGLPGEMLGVQGPTITNAAAELERAGLV
jgi:hypothetical protein